MENKSATIAEAAPVMTGATTYLDDVEKYKKDANDEEISDVMEMLQELAGRLQKMEEKMDLLISSINVKAEAENMSIDESSFGQESDERYSDNRFVHFSDGPDRRSYECFDRSLFGPVRGQQQTYDRFGPGQETDDRFGRFFNGGGQYNDNHFGPFFNGRGRGRGRGLHVGGRFAGGRCGGQGFCGQC